MLEQLKTAVGYVRFASLEDGSLQRSNAIVNYCTNKGILVEKILDDRDSGYCPLITRNGGCKLIDYVDSGEIDYIILSYLHELSRDNEELYHFLKLLKEKGIELIVLSSINIEKSYFENLFKDFADRDFQLPRLERGYLYE
ncbi:recombinase family protein [Alkalihalobacterium bogoriense]|uniref:recombinase family protein n=1 Tax=Alkalihalobacterium bogoriense TaxID=246272 RepID=UPI00047C49A8|nr:recombinase family protein [Alkalihalobacterium bogoriense]